MNAMHILYYTGSNSSKLSTIEKEQEYETSSMFLQELDKCMDTLGSIDFILLHILYL